MSDFSKHADDFSPAPIAPSFNYTEQQVEQQLDKETKDTAEAYFHPAWAEVEKLLKEEILNLERKPSEELSAEEYKIKSVADARAASKLKAVLLRVQDAVQAVESSKARKGGK